MENQLSLSQGVSVGGSFCSLVRSELWSFTIRGLAVSCSRGMSSVRTLPANRGVPPFSFPPRGRGHVTRIMVSQQGSGGQRRITGVYVTTATAEHQTCQSQGTKEPVAAMLKSPGSYQGRCTSHSDCVVLCCWLGLKCDKSINIHQLF